MVEDEQMIQKGLISVVMTNYNTPELFLREAIESILNQTYSNFEFIIVDDCSTDKSLSVIESYKDERIKIIKNFKNIGLTKSLNIALKVCKGEFIARMDSDDISLPTRFEKQVEFLKQNKEFIACGTWIKLFGNKNNSICRTIPDRESFRIHLLFGNYPNIAHPSAMFNHSLLLKYNIKYNENYVYAQDYRMWVSCSAVSECCIIPEILVNMRVSNSQISSAKKDEQELCAEMIVQEQLDKLHLTLSDDIKQYHMHLFARKRTEYNIAIKVWFKDIISTNKTYKVYNHKLLKKLLWKKWANICYYGLAQHKEITSIIKVLSSLNIRFYPQLLQMKIRKNTAK